MHSREFFAFRDDLDVLLLLEQRPDPLARERFILDDEGPDLHANSSSGSSGVNTDRNGMLRATRKPPSGAFDGSNVKPSP